ncbi:MAG: hypothetical protein NTX04_05210 [Verrucomicrobia bacterium]|nr:hypothetical protein [Verrucomicrobiota bacterium]
MKRSFTSPTLLTLLLLAGSIATPFSASPGGDLAQQQPKFSWITPPSPVLTGEAAIASFRLPPGFRIELVASEPLVQNPVAFAFDPDGRLFVVEMRGYMPDPDGKGEDQPNGDVVILEDTDGDGKFDKRTVFLDGLVLPRSIALAHGGVIVGEPPNLWFCRDHDGDGKCDEKTPIFTDYGKLGGPEYNPNGTLLALDNWFYSAHFGWMTSVASFITPIAPCSTPISSPKNTPNAPQKTPAVTEAPSPKARSFPVASPQELIALIVASAPAAS